MLELKDLLEFCSTQKNIYIYGAGRYGRETKAYLDERGVRIKAFLVSGAGGGLESGLPILNARKVLAKTRETVGIILALGEKNHENVRKLLQDCPCQIFALHDAWMQILPWRHFLSMLSTVEGNGKSSLDWRRILVIRLDLIGDMVWTTPFLRELKKNFSNAEITLVMRSGIASLLNGFPYVDKVVPYAADLELWGIPVGVDAQKKHLPEILTRVQTFAKQNFNIDGYDACFLPSAILANNHSLEEMLLMEASKAKNRYGRMLSNCSEVIYGTFRQYFTNLFKHEVGEHEVVDVLRLLEACGCQVECNNHMELTVSPKEIALTREKIYAIWGMMVAPVVAVGLVGREPARTWPAKNYAELIEMLHRDYPQMRFILLGGVETREAAAVSRKGHEDLCLDLSGRTTLPMLLAFIKVSDLYIGSNTGLLHIASAFQKPEVEIVPIFNKNAGWNRMGAWQTQHVKVHPRHGIDECLGLDQCERRMEMHCIRQIGVQEVYEAVKKILAQENDKCVLSDNI